MTLSKFNLWRESNEVAPAMNMQQPQVPAQGVTPVQPADDMPKFIENLAGIIEKKLSSKNSLNHQTITDFLNKISQTLMSKVSGGKLTSSDIRQVTNTLKGM